MQQIPKFFGDASCGVEIKKKSYDFEAWGGAVEGINVNVNDFIQGVVLEVQEAASRYPNQKLKYNLYLYNPHFKSGKIVIWGNTSLNRFLVGPDGSLLIHPKQFIQVRYDGATPLQTGKFMHKYTLAVCHAYKLTQDDELAVTNHLNRKQNQGGQHLTFQNRVMAPTFTAPIQVAVPQQPAEFVPVDQKEVAGSIRELLNSMNNF
jgi:hypothetical protein